ncbi:aspartate/glutamate racemase family protein [Sphingobacterium spiritivorum]|uniref:aspartate/glutamate racemase family protein n=1 Tax=Sphingobacterium spiritivorum TaxID=258 RepID=UPI003DA53818
MIGIVAGARPLAGLELIKKILEETIASTAQDHLPVLLSSQPHRIADRTQYLLDNTRTNPAYAIAEIISELEQSGATVVGIPCHTAHAVPIFDIIRYELQKKEHKVRLLHMVEETSDYIAVHFTAPVVGILTTTGIRNTGLYNHVFAAKGLKVIQPPEEWQEKIQAAIHDEQYGIKASSSPVTNRAKEELVAAIHELKKEGATVIILGCTELSGALREKEISGLPLVDPNRILARALIRTVAPEKLKD